MLRAAEASKVWQGALLVKQLLLLHPAERCLLPHIKPNRRRYICQFCFVLDNGRRDNKRILSFGASGSEHLRATFFRGKIGVGFDSTVQWRPCSTSTARHNSFSWKTTKSTNKKQQRRRGHGLQKTTARRRISIQVPLLGCGPVPSTSKWTCRRKPVASHFVGCALKVARSME